MAPSVMAFILLAIFRVSHGVENGNQDAPSPPSDKMKVSSNLDAILHRGPDGPSPLDITVYLKIAMVELHEYAAAPVAQGGSVMKDVRIVGEIAEGFVGRVENTLGTDFKLFKISPAQKMALDRALAKIEATTPSNAQSLDKWCQGAKNVMDELAFEGYAQATGCILVMKDLIRKIRELSTAQDQDPPQSEGTPVVVSRKLQSDPDPIPLAIPSSTSGDTTIGSTYPSLNSPCDYANEAAVLFSFQAPIRAVTLSLEVPNGGNFVYASFINEAGNCDSRCSSFISFYSPCIFPTTAGQTYRILVFAREDNGPAPFTLTIEQTVIPDPQTIQLEGNPSEFSEDTESIGSLYPESIACGFSFGLGVLHTFVASDPFTTAETCDSDIDTVVGLFKDGECIGRCDDDTCGSFSEQCVFRTIPGETYSVLVGGAFGGVVGPYSLRVTGAPAGPEVPICSSPVAGNTGTGTSQRSAGLGLLFRFLQYYCPLTNSLSRESHTSSFYSFQAAETVSTAFAMEASCEDVEQPVVTLYGADGRCLGSSIIGCDGSTSPYTIDLIAGETYLVGVSNFLDDYDAGDPFAFTLSISPEPTPSSFCSPVSSPSWCEKVTPLEYSLSGKGKKKAIKECLKYHLIGDSALPEEIGQIGLTSPGMLGLAGGLGLMALVAVMAVLLKRRFPAEPHWVPVPEAE